MKKKRYPTKALSTYEANMPKKETEKAKQAYVDFAKLGPGRNLPKLILWYEKQMDEDPLYNPPTMSILQLRVWSSRWKWTERLKKEGSTQRAVIMSQLNQRSVNIMETGFALATNRVEALKNLAELFYTELMTTGLSEDMSVFRLNALVNGFRGILDDIAKETGGRRDKKAIFINKSKVVDMAKKLAEELGVDPVDLIYEAEKLLEASQLPTDDENIIASSARTIR